MSKYYEKMLQKWDEMIEKWELMSSQERHLFTAGLDDENRDKFFNELSYERSKPFRREMIEGISRLLEETKILMLKGASQQNEPLLTLIQLACGYVIKELEGHSPIYKEVITRSVQVIRESLKEHKKFTELKLQKSFSKTPILLAINQKHLNMKFHIDGVFDDLRSHIDKILDSKTEESQPEGSGPDKLTVV